MLRELGLKLLLRQIACITLISVITTALHGTISMNSKNDPFPMFTTMYPYYFLYTYEKDQMRNIKSIKEKPEWFMVSVSPFGQNANCAKPLFKESCADLAIQFDDPSTTIDTNIEIGDLCGRWGMIPLLFGPTPDGQMFPPALLAARAALFPDVPLGTPIDDTAAIDNRTDRLFGYFSVPVEYRKRGLRFDILAMLTCDLGFEIKFGIADIWQAAKFNNKTCDAKLPCSTTEAPTEDNPFDPNNPNLTIANVNEFLMNNLKTISSQICYNIENFCHLSVEDLHIGLFWRHAYPMNQNRKGVACFEEFLLMPFFNIEGSIPLGTERPRNHAFALSYGSDDHAALGASAGLSIDFTETIEIAGEAGITHFFARDFDNVPIPTSNCQSHIFPFQTNVRVQPGLNSHFAAAMNAYHFMGCLSFYFQYVLIRHESDKICIKNNDCAFKPNLIEKCSRWVSQMANMGFNYDISPYITLGFLWQAPLSQRNAYKSTTVMFSFTATY